MTRYRDVKIIINHPVNKRNIIMAVQDKFKIYTKQTLLVIRIVLSSPSEPKEIQTYHYERIHFLQHKKIISHVEIKTSQINYNFCL